MLRLAILSSIFCLSSIVFSMQEERKIKEVVLDQKCIKTSPCQHSLKIIYENNGLGETTEETKVLNSLAIAQNYWDFLPLEFQYHLLSTPQVYELKVHTLDAN